MSKRIFKEDAMQARFEKEGFLTVPFIDPNEIKQLDELFDALHPDLPKEGFVSGSYSADLSYKKKASNEIVRIFSKHYERLFVNYQPFGGAFLFKMPSKSSELAIHQDWTIVDENKFVALNCWVPLTDIDDTNGALHVVPGSHYDSFHTVRAPTLPFFFSGNEEEVIKASVPMHVKAGEAVILNQSTIHYSPPNHSNKIRKAITAGVKSKGAPMRFHYFNQEKKGALEVFDMPEDFLISFENFYTDIFERPKMGSSAGFVDYNIPAFTKDKVISMIDKMKIDAGYARQPKQRKNFLQRLLSLATS
jgi:hypothetical protein